jgi:hypothetical protein
MIIIPRFKTAPLNVRGPSVGVRGEFKVVVSKDAECTKIVHESPWTENLITNSGLSAMGSYYQRHNQFGWIGTSAAAPAFTDSALVSPLTPVSGNPGRGFGVSTHSTATGPNWENYSEGSVQFPPDTGYTGTVTEWGLTSSAATNNNFSVRALLDTPVTKGDDDYLTIYYRRWMYPDVADLPAATVTLDGTVYDVTGRMFSSGLGLRPFNRICFTDNLSSQYGTFAEPRTSELQASVDLDKPSGSWAMYADAAGSGNTVSGVDGSGHYNTTSWTWGISVYGTLRCLTVSYDHGGSVASFKNGYVFRFGAQSDDSAPVKPADTHVLELSATVSWGRYPFTSTL